ncbi:hypothetical protein C5B42_06040 [Candidatus Cerribacteria bacterium 'Amazon FNV 2010 28 9']|uniref:Uncharacterized protein n=1 Tax=Candidatus Cerribacteria bacterium 'Amazon FNV 2010 28 9' TaxID=2081795 RepID=A0A317JRQ5_9BACT|nr:MAG: hypothetical protein C5B42_06040 [Candidatus Cerribacteria bacterium 'Amazon FNV 2010 28 9']
MLSKADKQYLESMYVSIETFYEAMKNVATKQDLQEIKDMMVEMLGQMHSYQQESTILSYRQCEHSDQLESHEKRLSLLEHNFSVA